MEQKDGTLMLSAVDEAMHNALPLKRQLMSMGAAVIRQEPPGNAVDLELLFGKKQRVEQEIKQEVKQDEGVRIFWCMPRSGGFTRWKGPTEDMDVRVREKTTVRVVGFDRSYWTIEPDGYVWELKIEPADKGGEYLTFEAITPRTYEVKFKTCARHKLTINIHATR